MIEYIDLAKSYWNDYGEFVTVCGSAVSLAISLYFSAKAKKMESILLNMQVLSWKQEYFADMVKWADEVSDTLSEIIHLCECDPQRMQDFFNQRIRIRSKISSLLDRGRVFFPNQVSVTDIYGKESLNGSIGFRQNILNVLAECYLVATKIDYVNKLNNIAHRARLVALKKEFTEQVKIALDPKSRDEHYKKTVESFDEI